MSLLLDALRKSEDQRRKGELPALDQPLSAPVIATESRMPRIRTLLLIFTILAMTLAAVGWWINRPDAQNSDEPIATEAISDLPIRTGPSSALVSAENQTAVNAALPTGTTLSESEVIAEENPAINSQDVLPADIDMPTVTDSDSLPASAMNTAGMQRVEETPRVVSAATETGPIAEISEPALEAMDEDSPAQPGPDASTAVVDADTGTNTATGPEAETELTSNYIYPWELPLEARQAFPELDLTVHVFTSDPSTRFVLINDQRYAEGDRLASGVMLEEITREGVILDYRNYRILLQ